MLADQFDLGLIRIVDDMYFISQDSQPVTPVPVPSAVLVGIIGLGTVATRLGRRRDLKT